MISDDLNILFVLLLVSLFGVAAAAFSAETQVANIQAHVFESITDSTTNAEIVQMVNSECDKTSWYVTKSACKTTVLDAFIISARN